MTRQVITFHYELKEDSGSVIDSSRQHGPISFLEGSDQIIPGLEEAILTFNKGDVKDVRVPYQDAYGPYDQTLVAEVPRSQFPEGTLEAGSIFQIEKDGLHRMITVVEVREEVVVIDANHPMAGKNLNFSVEIIDRRDATPVEIEHGHVHHHGDHHH